MGRKLQCVKSNSVNDNRKHVQYHIKSVTEHKKHYRNDYKHKVAKHWACKLIDRCRNCRACQTDCPKTNIRNNIRKYVNNAKQNGNNVFKAFKNGLDYASVIVREDKTHNKACYNRYKSNRANGNTADYKSKGENLSVNNEA